MLADQNFSRQEKSTSRAGVQVPLPKSAEFARTYIGQPHEDIDAQAHEAIDAVAAVVLGAQASLNKSCAVLVRASHFISNRQGDSCLANAGWSDNRDKSTSLQSTAYHRNDIGAADRPGEPVG